MPRLSDNKLLQLAITRAILDRQSLADAYDSEGEWAEQALEEKRRIEGLRGRDLRNLNDQEMEAAFLAFCFAEQYEEGRADAMRGTVEYKHAATRANQFRRVRMRRWGKTQAEVEVENAPSLEVFTILSFGKSFL